MIKFTLKHKKKQDFLIVFNIVEDCFSEYVELLLRTIDNINDFYFTIERI